MAIIIRYFGFLLLALCGIPALGATYIVTNEIDFSKGRRQYIGEAWFYDAFLYDRSVELTAGDTLKYTMKFADGKSFRTSNFLNIYFFLISSGGGDSSFGESVQVSLLNKLGEPFQVAQFGADPICCRSFIGQVASNTMFSDQVGISDYISIYGISYETTLFKTYTPNSPIFKFDTPGLYITALGVPDPQVWFTMVLGFSILGTVLRSQRSEKSAIFVFG